jgi:hypothetical protein
VWQWLKAVERAASRLNIERFVRVGRRRAAFSDAASGYPEATCGETFD